MNVLNWVYNVIQIVSSYLTNNIGFIVSVLACVITWGQFKISKHKKDDFLYDKRFQAYEELKGIMLEISSELWALNNKEIDCINAEFVRPRYNQFSVLIGNAELLFNDVNILDFMRNVQHDIACLFGVNGVKIVDDGQKLKILTKWNEYMNAGILTNLFQPYLKLV